MKQFSAFDAKTHFSSLLAAVEQGEQITITKYGRPIAKLVPFTGANKSTRANAIACLKAFSKGNTLDGLNWKQLRDEGRR